MKNSTNNIFNNGDKIVYVNSTYPDNRYLEENNIYTINDILNNGLVRIDNHNIYFDINDFISLEKYRTKKIIKICGRITEEKQR